MRRIIAFMVLFVSVLFFRPPGFRHNGKRY